MKSIKLNMGNHVILYCSDNELYEIINKLGKGKYS